MKTQNVLLKITLQPDELVQGENEVFVVVQNDSEAICEGLSIRVRPDDNIFINSESRITFPPLHSGVVSSSPIVLSTPSVGQAMLELRCSWKQQGQIYREDMIFSLNIKEDINSKKRQSDSPNYSPSYWRDYYLNSLTHWKKLYQLKQKEYHHLESQAAKYGALDVPFRITNQIDVLKKEILDLREKIIKAEQYLRDS